MATIMFVLDDGLKRFVTKQAKRFHSSTSEYLRNLIRIEMMEQDSLKNIVKNDIRAELNKKTPSFNVLKKRALQLKKIEESML